MLDPTEDIVSCPVCDCVMPEVSAAYERRQPCPDCGLPGDVLRLVEGWRRLIVSARSKLESPILRGDLGHMEVVFVDTPAVAVHLAPEPLDEELDLILTPTEARLWADQLQEMADLAQRAEWTVAVVEQVREDYMPGASNGRVIAVLDQLAAYMGRSPLSIGGEALSHDADRVLAAGVTR
jgi:hypothetical protein